MLVDQVDGRSVEGLMRANRRLASLAEKDPLRHEAADKFNIFVAPKMPVDTLNVAPLEIRRALCSPISMSRSYDDETLSYTSRDDRRSPVVLERYLSRNDHKFVLSPIDH